MINHIKEEKEFDEITKSGTVLVDFFATWCGPCKMLSPIVEELSEEMKDVTFVKIDVDEAPRIAARYEIYSIPTLILFKNGVPAKKQVGFIPKPRLKSFIAD